ncbi:response regulator [Clostridium sp. SHJSY1]|uniref:response regulator transcription factor n=1 Tax=Clostridium sp. SHJSY1 TaxID=2942483 RepID=UPI0028754D85|nr:response regulator [Clostridium sp. SHJSY1]MDS0524230.1 response regulator [Clostridium sp. SHJSY1]
MWRLVIADDENKIRKGIKKLLEWHEFNIDIVGEAEDGEIALKVVKEKAPDIVLLDINMPFLNGLNLLEKLSSINFKGIVIIISGYDDFSYAQKALQFNVFDYVLKPVNRKNLEEIIVKAVNKLNELKKENNYINWMKKQLDENNHLLKKNMLREWLNNRINDEELLRELKYFNINFGENIGIIVVKIVKKLNINIIEKKWDSELLEFAISNLLGEKFRDLNMKFIFEDEKKNVVLVGKIDSIEKWITIEKKLETEISEYLKCNVIIEQGNVSGGVLKVKDIYSNIVNNVNEKKKYNPIVLFAIKYMEENYYLNHLNINEISDKLEVTSSYLSKLLKKETGLSFIDYLTKIRIKKAMYIMEDPTIKIYDVAELIGYSNQHYFCKAFKKVLGISPTEYKRGKLNEK